MTGVATDASSMYSDLQTHNLLQSEEYILWSRNDAEGKDYKMGGRSFVLLTEKIHTAMSHEDKILKREWK